MGSVRTITLFSVQAEERQRISSVAVSMAVHVATAVLVSLGVYQAKLDKPIPATNFRVRRLDLQIPPDVLRAAKNPVEYQKAKSTPSPSSRARIEPPALREVAKVEHGPQTLIQPDVHTKVVLKEKVPVPSVAIWKPVTVPVEKIVAPLPQQAIQMQATPSLNHANQVGIGEIVIGLAITGERVAAGEHACQHGRTPGETGADLRAGTIAFLPQIAHRIDEPAAGTIEIGIGPVETA